MKIPSFPRIRSLLCTASLLLAVCASLIGTADAADPQAEIRTPKPPSTPRINGPGIFGVRPGHLFLYRIPATGDRPMKFAVEGLPASLKIDSATGELSGSLAVAGEHVVTLRATNAKGADEKKLKIVVGDTIALTPPLGWNSWNCWGPMVDAEKVRQSAKAMVDAGLIDHGWTYINIDDAWQAPKRGGPFNAIQGNEKFPDMKALCDEIHALGLKVGIYSTPWATSYAGYIGGSSDDPKGAWTKEKGRLTGKISFAEADARQWAAWGIDYLKYDWNPKSSNPRESLEEFSGKLSTMANALRASGRDMVFSYSNSMPFEWIGDVAKFLNCWRTTGDIHDEWWFLVNIGFGQNRWSQFSSPGHWNDPDMLVVGYVDVGKGRNLHPTRLTPDEQYTHITLWSLLASPLLIGCDMTRLDDFTLNLLCNDEVLAVNQDALGKQATIVSEKGEPVVVKREGRDQQKSVAPLQVWARPLEDGSVAVGLFNLGEAPATVTADWADLKISGKQSVRDLWRQKELGSFDGKFEITVAPHGAEMAKVYP
jgi:alpha-galactosidase